MLKQVDIRMLPSEAADLKLIKKKAAKKSKWSLSKVKDIRILKRSIDARGNRPYIQLRIELTNEEPFQADPAILSQFQSVENKKEVIIVGAGPAGYFAALELIEIGLRPVIFERGKKVQARRRDLRAIQQFGKVDPHSNYCFGEGGAGTYSDGKLYTRSHKKGSIQKALKLFVEHGAKSDIMIDAHPHIGSN
ncbi:MAG TPA: FAD-binding protein, partial [Saprospiraceae bacterium]|nr:FAD-binding protein [Saprospiraceae bacterium]